MSKNEIRIARVGMDGSLLSGPASAGGVSIAPGPDTKDHPRAIAFEKGTIISWDDPAIPFLSGGIPLGGARLDADGNLVDTTSLLLSRTSTGGRYYPPAMASGGDRTLLIWGTDFDDQGSGVVNASLLFP